jgi:MATE family multidrug resistance protein
MPSIIMFQFLVKRCLHWYGLTGSAIALVICQWTMCLMLLLHLRIFRETAYVPTSWPGLSLSFVKESLALEPLKLFLHLSMGGVASLSEWWFWECMCLIAGSFGVVQLCAHSIAYNIIPLGFMLPLGMSIGLSVRMGSVLVYDPSRAKKIAAWTMVLAAICGVFVGAILDVYQVQIIGLFTSQPEVFEQCSAIWSHVCYYIAVLYVLGINGAILRALGLQWTMAAVLGVTLWLVTLPMVLWVSIHNGGGLTSQWTILPVSYTFLQVFLASCYVFFDWETRSAEIRRLPNPQLSDLGNGQEQMSLLP